MSCHEWEEGTVLLSTAAFPKFRKDLIAAFNKRAADDYLEACRLHRNLVAAGAGKRKFDYRAALTNIMYGAGRVSFRIDTLPDYKVEDLLLTKPTADTSSKPRRPLKKDFPLAKWDTVTFSGDMDSYCLLDPKLRTVLWSVPENNHAVNTARNAWLARTVFGILGVVNWTRGTGGVIWGNDEYNRDARADGGGNYVTATFGPLGSKTNQIGGRRR